MDTEILLTLIDYILTEHTSLHPHRTGHILNPILIACLYDSIAREWKVPARMDTKIVHFYHFVALINVQGANIPSVSSNEWMQLWNMWIGMFTFIKIYDQSYEEWTRCVNGILFHICGYLWYSGQDVWYYVHLLLLFTFFSSVINKKEF